MDSCSGCADYESQPKRLKLDVSSPTEDVMCSGNSFTNNCNNSIRSIGTIKDTPQNSNTSQLPLLVSTETKSVVIPAHPDELDTSQNSLEVEDDNTSTVSHLSELSTISDISGDGWKPMAGSMIWIQKQMQNGTNPRTLLTELGIDMDQIPHHLNNVTLWKLIINILAEPPRRHKLRNVNNLDDVVRLLKGAKNIIVLTGAGVSVSCGIPDFRSRDGIYLRLAVDFPNLPDPQAMFDISYFNQDPRPFYKFAKDIYPGNFEPSPCHHFIKLLEKNNRLLRNYTQNIDTLEKVAKIDRVVECHGSFATASCTKCNHSVTADAVREIVLSQRIPLCVKCHGENKTSIDPDDIKDENELNNIVSTGIMKPDIVFFGEGLPDVFHEAMSEDKTQCDLLLVIGSSLKVRPVALIPNSLPAHVPQILINREPLSHCHFDVELLGDCDVIINHICHMMGDVWNEGVHSRTILQEAQELLPLEKDNLFTNTDSTITKFCLENSNLENSSNICDSKHLPQSSSSFENSTFRNCSSGGQSISSQVNEDFVITNKVIKERHMSIDSTRDSGIGENSNFTDVEKFDCADETEYEGINSHSVNNSTKTFWQCKVKKNLADRLPRNSFYLVPPSRYVFPGAEIFYNQQEKYTYFYDTSSSYSSESDSDVENSFRD